MIKMKDSRVNFIEKKAQMRIQQMAFILVLLILFFAIVATVFGIIWINYLRDQARLAAEENAWKMTRTISGTPELVFTSRGLCSSCVDMEKVIVLKETDFFKKMHNLDYMRIERVYPRAPPGECRRANFPDCTNITLIDSQNYGATSTAFVTLVRFVPDKGGYFKYELGKIYISAKEPTK